RAVSRGPCRGRRGRHAVSSPTPRVTTPAASTVAPTGSSATHRLGRVRPRPAAEKKKPAGMRIAATSTPVRASHRQPPSSAVASDRSRQTSPSTTSTPACAWPARKKRRWKSVAGTRPVTTAAMNAPPTSMVTTVSSTMPAVTRAGSPMSSTMPPRFRNSVIERRYRTRVKPYAGHVARPRLHDDALRRRLLEVTSQVVSAGGPEAVTVRDVAARAGTSASAVYALFGSRDALLAAVVEEGYRRFADHLAAAP